MAKQSKAKTDIETAASDAVKIIAQASSTAASALASAASDATKTIANAAAEAVKVNNVKGNDDHDLLIELKTKMDGLKSDIKEIKDGTSARIAGLEREKLDAKDSYSMIYKAGVDKVQSDHENRIKTIETTRSSQTILITIGIGLLSILTAILLYHVLGIHI